MKALPIFNDHFNRRALRPRLINELFASLALLLIPLASGAADFENLLSGKSCPLSIKLGDMNEDWRRITIRAGGSVSGNISVSVSGNGPSASSQNNLAEILEGRIYFTKGQVVKANGQVYLVAYHLPGSGLDLKALIQAASTQAPLESAVLSAETLLPLSLLDVRNMGNLDDIRAFDLKREIAESETMLRAVEGIMKAAGGSSSNNSNSSAGNESKD